VSKARAGGVTVVELPGDPIGPFYEVYRETAARAGFLIRTEQAREVVSDLWGAAGTAVTTFPVSTFNPAVKRTSSLSMIA
jgi:lipid II:glycine glycyltransferase (peptidoglycan interpeptide bridge formation enzyme)